MYALKVSLIFFFGICHFAVIISILKIADSFEKGRLEQAQLSNPLNTQLYIRRTQVTSMY